MRAVFPRMRISTCVAREHPPFANPGNATAWLSLSYKGPCYSFCLVCSKHLSCEKGGIRDLKRHRETEVHLATLQTIVAVSAKLIKVTTKVHTVFCISTFHFYWGFTPNREKYVEQVDKSFL